MKLAARAGWTASRQSTAGTDGSEYGSAALVLDCDATLLTWVLCPSRQYMPFIEPDDSDNTYREFKLGWAWLQMGSNTYSLIGPPEEVVDAFRDIIEGHKAFVKLSGLWR